MAGSLLGDFSAAEDVVADAVETALRRQARYREKLAQLQWPVQAGGATRLRTGDLTQGQDR